MGCFFIKKHHHKADEEKNTKEKQTNVVSLVSFLIAVGTKTAQLVVAVSQLANIFVSAKKC